jgi:hypothetical protein
MKPGANESLRPPQTSTRNKMPQFPPQTSNFNAFQNAFNFGAQQKGRARRREELSGFHLRPSMYLGAQNMDSTVGKKRKKTVKNVLHRPLEKGQTTLDAFLATAR